MSQQALGIRRFRCWKCGSVETVQPIKLTLLSGRIVLGYACGSGVDNCTNCDAPRQYRGEKGEECLDEIAEGQRIAELEVESNRRDEIASHLAYVRMRTEIPLREAINTLWEGDKAKGKRIAELEAMLKELTGVSPWGYGSWGNDEGMVCFYCDEPEKPGEHQPDCAWVKARKLGEEP